MGKYLYWLWCMVQSYKNESKSQLVFLFICIEIAVMYGTKLQKWEQITTRCCYNHSLLRLWCMVQSYKNERQSQRIHQRHKYLIRCDVWYKVTKMRANHNGIGIYSPSNLLWCMVQSYKNESKSQPRLFSSSLITAVMYGTKLQKWEQITTRFRIFFNTWLLWCMVQSYKNESKSQRRNTPPRNEFAVMYGTKLQKWEQITTYISFSFIFSLLWCMVQSYKNESKSQLQIEWVMYRACCDVWYKVTKMRANHNPS